MIKTAEASQTAKQAYAAKLRQVLRRFDRLEETTVSDMIKALNVFRRDVIALLSGLPSDDEFNAFRLGALKDELDTMIPVLNTQLTQIANGAVMSGGRLGHETITEPLIAAGVTTFYNTPSLALINSLQDWTADLITGITEDTRKAISGEIRRVGLGGISPHQAMQNITRLMGFEARGPGKYVAKGIGYNAERIARTETNRALNLGAFTQSQEVARETPEAQKRWNATGDFRTRSAHLSAHGQLRPLDEPFNVGGELLAYPLDPAGSGKNTINCRCRMTIVHPEIGVVGGPLDGQIGAERKRRGTAAPLGKLPPVIGKVNPETLAIMQREFDKIAKDYPELRDWVKGFDFTKAGPGDLGEYDSFTHTVRLSPSYAKLTPAEIQKAIGTSDFFVGNDALISTTIHEVGHAIDRGMVPRFTKFAPQGTGAAIVDAYFTEVDKLMESTGFVSGYAETNRREWVAEKFTQERLSGKRGPLENILNKYMNQLRELGINDEELPTF